MGETGQEGAFVKGIMPGSGFVRCISIYKIDNRSISGAILGAMVGVTAEREQEWEPWVDVTSEVQDPLMLNRR